MEEYDEFTLTPADNSYDEFMLTTADNPYDPFDQFSSWYMFDVEKNYNSCSMLGRIVKVSDQYTEREYAAAVEAAIDEIIKYDFLNIYKKVKRNTNKQK